MPPRIWLLSQDENHSTRRLSEAGRERGIEVTRIGPRDCSMLLGNDGKQVLMDGAPVDPPAVLLPRGGAESSDYELNLIEHFEAMEVPVVNDAHAIALTRDKFHSLMLLHSHGVPVPRTALLGSETNLDSVLDGIRGPPYILKVRRGTRGVGVMIAESRASVHSILSLMWEMGRNIIVQEYVEEAKGTDLRALVLEGEVVAAMRRTAPVGEFRANIFLGGRGEAVKLSEEYQEVAIKAAEVVNLAIAGVDLMEAADGPKVIEINSAPDFEGLERCTGLDIAGMKLDLVMDRVEGR